MGDTTMHDTTFDPESDSTESRFSRRRVLGTTGVLLAGGGGLAALASDPASASVTMGSLDVADEEVSVGETPEHIYTRVSGEYAVDGATTPDQTRTVLQIGINGTADDLATNVYTDAVAEGTYTLEGDLMEHRGVGDEMVTPPAGEARIHELDVRVILLAVVGGEIHTEKAVSDTATLVLKASGFDISLGGTGTVEVVTPA